MGSFADAMAGGIMARHVDIVVMIVMKIIVNSFLFKSFLFQCESDCIH